LYIAAFWTFQFATTIAVIEGGGYSCLMESPGHSTWAFILLTSILKKSLGREGVEIPNIP
jgi:hypothetical protein